MLNKIAFYLTVVLTMFLLMIGLFLIAFPVNQIDGYVGATTIVVALGTGWIAHKLETK